MNPYQAIVELLKTNKVAYKEFDHDPIYTTEESGKIEGLSQEAGAKSLLLKTKQGFVLVVLSGSARLDSKKLKKALGIKDMRFASPAEVQQTLGCIVGACYPFGSIAQVATYLDKSFTEHDEISFNPGLHDKSIQIRLKDYLQLENPTQLDLAAS